MPDYYEELRDLFKKKERSKYKKEYYEFRKSWGGNPEYYNNLLKIDTDIFTYPNYYSLDTMEMHLDFYTRQERRRMVLELSGREPEPVVDFWDYLIKIFKK